MAMKKCPKCNQEVYEQAEVCPYCGFHMNKKICVICNKEIEDEQPPIVFHSFEKDEDAFCCEECEKQLDIIQESKNPAEVKKAINYVYTYACELPDGETKENLLELLSLNAPVVEEMEEKVQKAKPVSDRQKDYFAENKNNESGMFSNVGTKIKEMTSVFCWIGIIAFVIAGIFLLAQNNAYYSTVGVGLTVMLVGPLVCWLSSLVMYGFGELIDEVKKNNRLLEQLWDNKGVKKK